MAWDCLAAGAFGAAAALFGAGAALTLDEFALWLHLEDVYWTAEGRSSVDAVMLALLVGLLGFVVIGVDDGAELTMLARELQRREARYGLETMCIGGGQGLAAVFERVA